MLVVFDLQLLIPETLKTVNEEGILFSGNRAMCGVAQRGMKLWVSSFLARISIEELVGSSCVGASFESW